MVTVSLPTYRRIAILALLGGLLMAGARSASAQVVGGVVQQVGGVWIDADGMLRNREVDETNQVRAAWQQGMAQVPADARQLGLRKVSLRKLEEAILEHRKTGKPLDDEMKYLAGLQHIQYVFVYPDQHDIVLAGPGEGWRVNEQGEVVGLTTGRPVMWLDDLLVALRTGMSSRQTGVSCSIDPTDEGIQRYQSLRLDPNEGPEVAQAAMIEALGPQRIRVGGVPADSHFARVLVAADYKMKRIAMNFDASPVRGIPSFLHMIKGSTPKNALPRWWLEPNYQALLASPDGMAFEIRGASVKAMTEQDFVAQNGERKRTGKSDPMAKKWADMMTAHYDELASKDAVFGQLRNCIDLAVVAALIVKDQLPERANYSMSVLLHDDQLPTEKFNTPKQVASQASLLQKGSNWIISASGGVQVFGWEIAGNTEQSTALTPARDKAAPAGNRWWWN